MFQGLRYCLLRSLLASGSFANCSSSRFQRSLRPSLKAMLATCGALVERCVVSTSEFGFLRERAHSRKFSTWGECWAEPSVLIVPEDKTLSPPLGLPSGHSG